MITNEIIFFENQTVPSLSKFLYNVNDGTLVLKVEGNVNTLNINVYGNTELTDDNFSLLKAINATTYKVMNDITEAGTYWIDINGIRKAYVEITSLNGEVNVIGLTKSGLTTDLVARAMAAGAAEAGDYDKLTNKPSINGVELDGNKTSTEIKVASDAAISDVAYEGSTGILTFTRENGETVTVDLPLELLIQSGSYDEATKSIILVLANGDTISINVEDLISVYGSDGTTIEMYVQDGVNTFKIADAIIEKINNAAKPDNETIVLNADEELEAVGLRDIKTAGVNKFWTGTKAEYDALTTKDENVFYAITDDDDTATKAEIGVELNGTYTDDTLSLSLLNPYSEVLSTTTVAIPAGGSTYEVTLTKDASDTITANKTMAEIKAAQTAGNIIYVAYDNSLIPLVFVGDNTLKFTMVSDSQSITISCDNDVWSEVATSLLPLSGGTMTGALNLYGNPTSDNEATTKGYVDSKITSSQLENNTLYFASIDGTNDDWYTKAKLQPVLQEAYTKGYHDIMIKTTTGSRFITCSGGDLQSLSKDATTNLQFVSLQNITGSTTNPTTIFYGYCYANGVKLDDDGNVTISGTVGKTGGSVKAMKDTALTEIAGYDAAATQVLKNVNGVLTWTTETEG